MHYKKELCPKDGYKKGYKTSWVVEESHGKAKRHLGPYLYIHGAIVWMGNLLNNNEGTGTSVEHVYLVYALVCFLFTSTLYANDLLVCHI